MGGAPKTPTVPTPMSPATVLPTPSAQASPTAQAEQKASATAANGIGAGGTILTDPAMLNATANGITSKQLLGT